MTTHVFIVDDNTFKYHLEYMFAGTGAKKMLLILIIQKHLDCIILQKQDWLQ